MSAKDEPQKKWYLWEESGWADVSLDRVAASRRRVESVAPEIVD